MEGHPFPQQDADTRYMLRLLLPVRSVFVTVDILIHSEVVDATLASKLDDETVVAPEDIPGVTK